MNEHAQEQDDDDLGLRWEHGVWPDGEPFVRTDLRRGDLWLRLTLHLDADGHLELVALDLDDHLGLAGGRLCLDETLRRIIALLMHNRRPEGKDQSGTQG